MEYRELEAKVLEWAKIKGILNHATPLGQGYKTKEETEELIEALHWQVSGYPTFINKKRIEVITKEEIADAFGDILVTIIIGAKLQGMDLLDCLAAAYNVIAKRTGRMENGQFKKDE